MKVARCAVIVVLTGCTQWVLQAQTPDWVNDTSTFAAKPAAKTTGTPPIADRYRPAAAKIISAARADGGAYAKLSDLTDQIGNRIAGSANLERAVQWAVAAMKADGLDVRTDKVMVPHWVRGGERAELVKPIARPLHILGLGGSVGGDITAPVVVVHDWKELETKGEQVKGSIVLYNVAMPAWTPEKGSGYGDVVPFRTKGAAAAAKRGAVASLVRSVTAHSLRTAHTGAMGYEDGVAKIPSAAVTVEDAELLERLAKRGPVTLHLKMEAQTLPDVESANVIGELRGREKPDEIVMIGGHLDSWDVGQGAHDDGAGCVTTMQAIALLKKLGLTPRRTIRVVLFTNEENGLRGGKAYAEQHKGDDHVAALEADSGAFPPRGISVGHSDKEIEKRARARMLDIGALVKDLGVSHFGDGHGGADISPLASVVQLGFETEGKTYFDIHHTEADTLDKVDPAVLADDVAAVAVIAYVIAEMEDRLDR